MSSSIVYFLRRTKRAASATFDHIEFKPARLSVYVCVPNARWLLRSPGPYFVRAANEPNVPIRRGDSTHPLFRELDEPTDSLDIEPCPTRKVLGALGAMCIAHNEWTLGAAIPFGKFLFRAAHVLAHGGRLALGPRTFVRAMKQALDRFEVPSTVSIVRPERDEFTNEMDLVLFGEGNYVRAAALTAEEVAFDHGA